MTDRFKNDNFTLQYISFLSLNMVLSKNLPSFKNELRLELRHSYTNSGANKHY